MSAENEHLRDRIVRQSRELIESIRDLKENHGPHITYGFCWNFEQATQELKGLVEEWEKRPHYHPED